jgi:hypothetical protein
VSTRPRTAVPRTADGDEQDARAPGAARVHRAADDHDRRQQHRCGPGDRQRELAAAVSQGRPDDRQQQQRPVAGAGTGPVAQQHDRGEEQSDPDDRPCRPGIAAAERHEQQADDDLEGQRGDQLTDAEPRLESDQPPGDGEAAGIGDEWGDTPIFRSAQGHPPIGEVRQGIASIDGCRTALDRTSVWAAPCAYAVGTSSRVAVR